MKNQKVLATSLVLLGVVILAVIVGIVYFNKAKNSQTAGNQNRGKLKTVEYYKSPLGFQFKMPVSGKVTEFSFDIANLGKLSNNDLIYPPQINTSTSSVGTRIETDPYRLTVTKLNSIGIVPEKIIGKMGYGGGDFFQFFGENKSWFEEIKTAINKRSIPASFDNSGQIQRFGTISYSTPNKQFSGISNFRISGFAVPELGLFKEYFLIDNENKFIFYVVSTLDCSKKDQLEEDQRQYNADGSYNYKSSFDSGKYNTTLHSIAQECENTSKNKADLDLLLNSLKLN